MRANSKKDAKYNYALQCKGTTSKESRSAGAGRLDPFSDQGPWPPEVILGYISTSVMKVNNLDDDPFRLSRRDPHDRILGDVNVSIARNAADIKVEASENMRQDEVHLRPREIDAQTRPGTATEGHEVMLQLLLRSPEPSLRPESARIGEDVFILVKQERRHRYDCSWRDLHAVVRQGLVLQRS